MKWCVFETGDLEVVAVRDAFGCGSRYGDGVLRKFTRDGCTVAPATASKVVRVIHSGWNAPWVTLCGMLGIAM